jgi:hypothetical protein
MELLGRTYIAFANQKGGPVINFPIQIGIFQFRQLSSFPSNGWFTKVPVENAKESVLS